MDTAMPPQPQSSTSPPPGPVSTSEDALAGMHALVQTALDYKLKGNPVTYNVLVSKLENTSEDEERRQLYLVLPRCISTLTKDLDAYHELVHRIYTFDFLTTMPIIDAYIRLITHLVTAHTSFLQPTIHMLVRNLLRVPRPAPLSVSPLAVQIKSTLTRRVSIGIPTVNSGPSEAELAAQFEASLQQRFASVHAAFEKVLHLVPASIHHVFQCLCEYYPHKRLETPIQLSYLTNLFQLTTYAKGLQERVLGLVVEKLVAIDVEIKLEATEEDVFTMDDFLDDATCVDPENLKGVDEMADKLDHLMLATFTYLEAAASDHPRLFAFLLKSFDQSILNTHRSKYPQFLLFYICKSPSEHQELLLSQLISVALDAKVPPVTRLSCSSYLASYVARAKYLGLNAIKHTLFHIMRYIHGQVDVLDEAAAAIIPPSSIVDKCLVDLVQSACYIVCFRGLELCGSEAGYTFVRSLGWTRVLTSRLHPMRHAAFHGAVAAEFMNVAELLGLVSDEAIEGLWEGMKQAPSAKTLERSSSAATASMCFFPFDPYLLRRSFRFIGPLYLYWKHADPTFSGNSDAFAMAQTHMKAFEAREHGSSSSDDDDDVDDNASMSSSSYVSMGGNASSFVRSSLSEMSVVGSFTGSEDFEFGGRHNPAVVVVADPIEGCDGAAASRGFKTTSLYYHDEEEIGF
ncbi:hypothetical protein H257_00104 [Aphanomyces astaci]|uniref:RNA polymerase I-specific transcription initiation factor RRN3 n=1 Tax=Aphanomyces astaci TaxID=112090 RepID=W4H914_APHAT|nr:hypothetical protein H257_00104 [Aphanomyces astaci]ETV88535.1 hypothetical protein H257_00104 [Aphanomyces astaci]|eukprot:XP_009820935.1 hypothetical protein H257_00104 [Aphanomyces astaci]